MNDALVLVVSLWIEPDRSEEFAAFEQHAARLMARYGGMIERVIRLPAASSDAATPFEVHLVTFPDAMSFQQYRADPEVQELAPARARVIRHTIVLTGYDCAPYS